MANLRFAMLGTGFWAWYQLPGWIEAGGVECVALYNRTVARAEKLNEAFGGKMRVYDNVEKLLDSEDLDFIDICTAASLRDNSVGRSKATRQASASAATPTADAKRKKRKMVRTKRTSRRMAGLSRGWMTGEDPSNIPAW